MKEEILNLRKEGKTYKEIKEILNCSKSTISYYCGNEQKQKSKIRRQKRRQNSIIVKLENFKYRKNRNLKEKTRRFNKRDMNFERKTNKILDITFNADDVIKKFGVDTICYLSGEKINLYDEICHFDHILPTSKGGNNSIDNLGVTHKIANQMKSDLTIDELIEWCIKILSYNGYEIKKGSMV